MRVKNGHLFHINHGSVNEFNLPIVNPPTCGVFTVTEKDEYETLMFQATKSVNFSFFIALIDKDNTASIALRAIFRPNNGIVLVQGDIGAANQNGKLRIPEQFNLNNALIVGIEPKEKILRLQFKIPNAPKMIATWIKYSGWHIDDELNGAMKQRIIPEDGVGIKCGNCGRSHLTENCYQPYYSMHCRGCLVVSIYGHDHTKPCLPTNRISATRTSILSEEVCTLFQIDNSLNDVEMFYMADDIFQAFEAGTKLLSSPAETVIIANRVNDKQIINLMQTSLKRCNILIAVEDQNRQWRYRFRIVVTVADGLVQC